MRNPESITVNEDSHLIPMWSIIVAAAAFVLVEYYFWMVLPGQRTHPPPPLGFRIYFNLSWGLLASVYFLMVGYVSKDAPRRAMSARFWIVLCLVMPAASALCSTSCCVSRRYRSARPARRRCRATSTSARNATIN